jgi:hypothetical protein
MSASPSIKTLDIYSWNFSSGMEMVYGGSSAHKEISPGIWGMFSGDADGNEAIDGSDKITIWEIQPGTSGYKTGDCNLDGQVNNPDKNGYLIPNLGKRTSVPE